MALGPIHCGSFLLLAAFALLLVATISAPVVNNISFLDITQGSQKTTFGVFGYCSNARSDTCSKAALGYPVSAIQNLVSGSRFGTSSIENLSKALILHPIATGITFLAVLVALCSDRLGFIFASLLAFVAFLVSLASMIVDFTLFTIIRNRINDNTTARASFANAIWLVLAATIILFFSVFFVLFSCCTARRNRRRGSVEAPYASNGYVGNAGPQMGYAPARKTRFWQRNKY